MIKYWKIKFL